MFGSWVDGVMLAAAGAVDLRLEPEGGQLAERRDGHRQTAKRPRAPDNLMRRRMLEHPLSNTAAACDFSHSRALSADKLSAPAPSVLRARLAPPVG
jgi:hypothetical protein